MTTDSHDRAPGSPRYALETSVASMVDITEKLRSLGLDKDPKLAGQRLAEELLALKDEVGLCRLTGQLLTRVLNLRNREPEVEVTEVERDQASEIRRTVKRRVQPEMQATASAFCGCIGVLISHAVRDVERQG